RPRNIISGYLQFLGRGHLDMSEFVRASEVLSEDFSTAGKWVSNFTDIPMTLTRGIAEIKPISKEKKEEKLKEYAEQGLLSGKLDTQYIEENNRRKKSHQRKVLDNKITKSVLEGYKMADNVVRVAIYEQEK